MFHKILIANRGEIACRIIHTARRLGIKTVAVYSEADAHAPHVKLADEAYFIGPSPAQESYLRIDKIIECARKSTTEAIHPGYGFLSENADFAKECSREGFTFIGPSIEALKIMGSKSESKKLMEKIGIPTIPGYHGANQTLATLIKESHRIGFPLMIKASAGGGGKGMRIVKETSYFQSALESAQREIMTSFKDPRLLLEKFVESPRHIEVQIFGDTHGNRVHFFERDCSLQRRYQKILEEAPAPNLSLSTQNKLYQAALDVAHAVNYIGAGTVEFLVDTHENFYFMEMNTRLQVEHPVTEMITNQDLVEWQLLVAYGEKLPLPQSQITKHGHAMEVRLCAESPSNDFLPTTGTLTRFYYPKILKNVRYETGVMQGSVLSVYYDPMITKVVAWGEKRDQAIKTLEQALSNLKISGVHTNKAYLSAILKNEHFLKQELSTQFIDHYHQALLKEDQPPLSVLLMVSVAKLIKDAEEASNPFCSTFFSWRLNDFYQQKVEFTYGAETYEIEVSFKGTDIVCFYKGRSYEGKLLKSKSQLILEIVEERLELISDQEGSHLSIDYHDETYTFGIKKRESLGGQQTEEDNYLSSPMPGKIIAIKVQIGSLVGAGDPLVILEAMKMEHTLKAPFDGIIESLPYQEGMLVEEGIPLVSINPQPGMFEQEG